MADELLNDGEGDIFVYTGGDQEVPHDVRRAKIDESVDTILARAFYMRTELIEVVGHNKLKKIEHSAFNNCLSLKRLMKMTGVKEIENHAFLDCEALSDAEFVNLEIVGRGAFGWCKSLKFINMPSVRRVGVCAFEYCTVLTESVFGEELERIEVRVFDGCYSLRRIAIPLKRGLIVEDDALRICNFIGCDNLSRVDIVGGIHETISSLHLESWRNEMREQIDQINQTLLETSANEKTAAINQWISSVLNRMENYKAEHQILLKEAMALLELALWKARLEENGSTIDTESEIVAVGRKQHRVTCGANIVIKNVLSFLVLEK